MLRSPCYSRARRAQFSVLSANGYNVVEIRQKGSRTFQSEPDLRMLNTGFQLSR
jgi:hypothetical protein